ncbi:FkbM family methyltransferase [Pedobacter sp. KR3-3]|uniref:FkbM family methyltransferase n=1 Tax=Pedobacter albus TaxID=3113905 RepID=A0ABU7IBG3_9SPHI|nr:FkbM family methyltransferase [Pedobacter sp. KR3-3]MEE1946808.1 FkbM family methyltransferase [Pedobacter sp. KR3-3]
MIKNLKRILSKYLPVHYFQYSRSYSQDGEDMILKALFEQKKNYKGFFVDVGAHHPVRFSNTQYFYKRGWRGINIEPTPDAIKAFRLFRKRDINLNIGIGETRGELKFYCFNEPALNSFSKEVSMRVDAESNKYKIIKVLDIPVLPLAEVFDQYLPKGQTIDFLSIDVEGLDFQVLLSNNWELYKPSVILVEENVDVDAIKDSKIYTFLKEKGYSFFAKTLRTCVYRLNP